MFVLVTLYGYFIVRSLINLITRPTAKTMKNMFPKFSGSDPENGWSQNHEQKTVFSSFPGLIQRMVGARMMKATTGLGQSGSGMKTTDGLGMKVVGNGRRVSGLEFLGRLLRRMGRSLGWSIGRCERRGPEIKAQGQDEGLAFGSRFFAFQSQDVPD